ncbi:MAG TPA: HNH endonuclease signature motif containing protein [Blastocatellia bacterium]|nr:HNH endonuclease signature motif containing protein [Blastocatellia bacterium]
MAVSYKGGCRQICSYDRCFEALEFHHLDPTQKDFGISKKGYTRSWEKVKNEIDKCLLLCANCHREFHAGKLQLPQVTVVEKSGEFKEA